MATRRSRISFLISGNPRNADRELWFSLCGPKPVEGFVCDGASWSPDVWRGFPIWVAAVIHDFHYRSGVLGASWASRRRADNVFRKNVRRVVRFSGGGPLSAWRISSIYWLGVRLGGWSSYSAGRLTFAFSRQEEGGAYGWRECLGAFRSNPGAYEPVARPPDIAA